MTHDKSHTAAVHEKNWINAALGKVGIPLHHAFFCEHHVNSAGKATTLTIMAELGVYLGHGERSARKLH